MKYEAWLRVFGRKIILFWFNVVYVIKKVSYILVYISFLKGLN